MENTELKTSYSLADIASMLESYKEENGASSKEARKLEKAIKDLKSVEISKKKQQIKEEMKSAKQQYKEAVKGKKEELKELGSSMIVVDKAKDVFGGIRGFFGGVKDKAIELGKKAVDKIVDVKDKAVELGGKAVNTVVDTKDKAIGLGGKAVDKAVDVKDKAIELGGKAVDKAVDVKDKAIELGGKAVDRTKQTITGVKNQSIKLAGKAADKLTNIKNQAKELGNKTVDKVVDKTVDVKDKAVELGNKVVDKTKETVNDKVVNPAKSKLFGIKETFESAKMHVNSTLSKVTEKISEKLGKASKSLQQVSENKLDNAIGNEAKAQRYAKLQQEIWGNQSKTSKEQVNNGPNLENIKNLNKDKDNQR